MRFCLIFSAHETNDFDILVYEDITGFPNNTEQYGTSCLFNFRVSPNLIKIIHFFRTLTCKFISTLQCQRFNFKYKMTSSRGSCMVSKLLNRIKAK